MTAHAAPDLQPDLAVAAAFLAALTGSADTPVTFQTFHDRDKGELAAHRHGTLAKLAPWLTAQNRKGAGVFVTVNETDGKGRSKANIVSLRALFVEDDKGAIADAAELQPDPSIIVESKNGAHIYWLLQPGQAVGRAEPALASLIHHLGTDAKIKDVSRVLRLPGFYHLKSDPFMVTLRHADDSRRYTIDDLLAVYPPPAVEPRPPRAVPSAPVGGPRSDADLDAHYARQALAGAAREVAATPEGERNDFLNKQAFKMGTFVGAGVLDAGSAEDELIRAGVAAGLPESEGKATVRSGLRAGERKPHDMDKVRAERKQHAKSQAPSSPAPRPAAPVADEPAPFSEDYSERGQSRRFARLYGKQVKFCSTLGFLVYDGKRWDRDEGEARAMELVKAMIEEIGQRAAREHAAAHQLEQQLAANLNAGTGDDAQAKEIKSQLDAAKARAGGCDKAFKELSKRSAIRSVVLLAATDPRILAKSGRFDADPWLFNVANGTIDLRTGKLRPHSPRDLITKLVPIPYDEGAESPHWEAFLMSIMANRPSLVRFLQVAMGYSLSGSTREQCFFILHGKGSNGKTVFSKTTRALLGDYGSETPAETLMIKRNENGVPNDLARLAGVRMVGANETEDGQRLAEAKVKALTGDDPIVARFLNKEFFEFQPEFKLWLRTNHKPVIKGTDEGIWRRIHLIPFDMHFTPDQQDRALGDRLLAELPGILSWAVRGVAMWLAEGLVPPLEITAASTAYRKESDTLGAFLEGLEVREYRGAEIYGMYADWCKKTHERELTATQFGRSLTDRRWEKRKNHGTVMRTHPLLNRGIVQQTIPQLSPDENRTTSRIGIVGDSGDSFTDLLHDEREVETQGPHAHMHEANLGETIPTIPGAFLEDPDPLGEWVVAGGGFGGQFDPNYPPMQNAGGAE